MSLKTIIKDPNSGLSAEIANHDEKNALVVATRQLKTYTNSVLFFSNDTYGDAMNQDAGFSGTPEKVHDGTDSILWTASDIVGGGKTTFDSTDQNHTTLGTKSIKIDNSPVDDVFQLAKGSDINCNNYTAITMWIYAEKDWKLGDVIEMYGWDNATNQQVGTSVDIKDYFSYSVFNVWHKLTIPLRDFGAMASSLIVDALRFSIVTAEGKSPKWYLDDVQFEEVGTPIKYTLKPRNGTWLHVNNFCLSLANELPATVTDGTMPGLSYDDLLGLTLPAGISYKREQAGETQFTVQLKDLMDIIQLPSSTISNQGSDGTNTFITIDLINHEPLILKAENNDELSFTVNDNMSSLLHFRASAGCRVEDRMNRNTHN